MFVSLIVLCLSAWGVMPDYSHHPHHRSTSDMKIHAYLNFENKTEEAFRFYEKILGGKLSEFYRFGAMPPQGGFELTPEQKNLVMHVALALPDGQMIMGSDMLPGMGPK